MKACPRCHALVHASELNRLAAEAARATEVSDTATALAAWRKALELLPGGTRQHSEISARVAELSARADVGATPPPPGGTGRAKWLGGLGALGLALWKLKFVFVFLLGKGKLLLLGLTKASTFFSMALSLGVYWAMFGWRFAAGLIASIYVHEMGHVAALRRFGIAATAPMFIPGFGALVRLKQYPASPREDARVGLAGPLWGTGAALAFGLVGVLAGWPSLVAIARVGAWLNLFNLLPIWQLDGGRGFNALSRVQRFACSGAALAVYLAAGDGLLLVLTACALLRATTTPSPPEGDRTATAQFIGLLVVLGGIMEAARRLVGDGTV